MDLSRRDFIKLAALAPVVSVACGIPEKELEIQSIADFPEDLVKGKDAWFATQCGSCPDGCGIIVRIIEGRAKKIEGNLDYPLNRGKHMARCEAALQAVYHPDRIKTPLKRVFGSTRGSGDFVPMDWDEALSYVEKRLQISEGKTAIMTNPTRGHLGLVIDKFAAITKAQHITYEEMDRVVVRNVVRDVFGQARLPRFDIANANTVLSFGSDFLGTWFSPVSMSHDYAGFRGANGKHRGYFIHVEPRMSQTAANADWWIPIQPGNEGLLALSVAYVIIKEGWGDQLAANLLTNSMGAKALDDFAPENVAGRIGIPELRGKQPPEVIKEIAKKIASEGPSVVIGGGSAAAHTNGSENLQAIYSLNHLIGSVGKIGGVILNPSSPLSVVPDSASGASYMEWKKAVEDIRSGSIRNVIVHGIDPVYVFGESLDLTGAFSDDNSIISVANFFDDTALMADVILPELSHLESWGSDIPDPGPGYQVMGIQQPVLNPPVDASLIGNFGDILLKVANNMNVDSIPWNSMHEVVEQGFKEVFGLHRGSVKAVSFSGFWQGVLQRGGWWDISMLLEETNHLTPPLPMGRAEPQFDGPVSAGSFYLVPVSSVGIGSGDLAHLPWLQALPDPLTTVAWSTWLEINDKEAESRGISEGDVLQLKSSRGSINVVAYLSPAIDPKIVAVLKGQGHKDYGRYAKERGANVDKILATVTDHSTGAHAWAATRVTLRKTGDSVEIPRYEGTQLAVDPGLELHGIRTVVKVTKGHMH